MGARAHVCINLLDYDFFKDSNPVRTPNRMKTFPVRVTDTTEVYDIPTQPVRTVHTDIGHCKLR